MSRISSTSPDDAASVRVLVVGCGFIGRHMAIGLAAAGHEVRVLSRRPPPADVVAAVSGENVHLGDANRPDVLGPALAGVAHVVWCAGGLLPPDADADPDADERGTLDPLCGLLAALDGRPQVRITYISSGGAVYGNTSGEPIGENTPTHPIGAYGRHRLAAEHLLRDAERSRGQQIQILRCANVYGPGQPADRGQGAVAVFVDRVRSGAEIPLIGHGQAIRDFVYVGDVVSVVVALLGRSAPHTLNVGSGEGVSIRELLTVVEETLGRTANLVETPARSFDVDRVVLSVDRLRAVIPYTPIRLAEGVALTAAAPPVATFVGER